MAEQKLGTYDNPYKFNGKELDQETGFYYYGARYYNPRTSLWLSVDPLASYNPIFETQHYIDGQHNGGVFNNGNLNSYGYCYQNPVLYIDPNGKQTYFALGASSDGSGKGYGTDFKNKLNNLGISNVHIVSATGKNWKSGDSTNFLEDVSFTIGPYANSAYKDLYTAKVVGYRGSYGTGGPIPITESVKVTLDNAAPRIKQLVETINKSRDGGNLNLIGLSAGSVLVAQTAIALAESGVYVDSVTLIASPTSVNEPLYKDLITHKNIGKVLRIDYEGDDVGNMGDSNDWGDAFNTVWGFTFGEHPHMNFSDKESARQEAAEKIVKEGISD